MTEPNTVEQADAEAPRQVFDKADYLPYEAQRRLEILEEKREAGFSELRHIGEQVDAALSELRRARAQLTDLERSPPRRSRTERMRDKYDEVFGAEAAEQRPADYAWREVREVHVTEVDHAGVNKKADEVNKLDRKYRLLQARRDKVGARVQEVGRVHDRALAAVKGLRAPAARFDSELPKPPAGDPAEAITWKREQRLALLDQIRDIEVAPEPSSVVKERVGKMLDRLEAAGRPQLDFLDDPETGPWPARDVDLGVVTGDGGMGRAHGSIIDVLAVLCWVKKDDVVAGYNALIDAQSDDENALTAEEKAARIAELRAKILLVEREEAEVLWSAYKVGTEIIPRGDMDVRAFLGVADDAFPNLEE